jgi:predicted nucleic acid-binding protein
MRWLLDTNVISEIRHPQGDQEVKRRIAALPSEALYISAIVYGELVKGVRRLPDGERKSELMRWLHKLETDFGDRILPFDRDSAKSWGDLVAGRESRGTLDRDGGWADRRYGHSKRDDFRHPEPEAV